MFSNKFSYSQILKTTRRSAVMAHRWYYKIFKNRIQQIVSFPKQIVYKEPKVD